MARTDNALVVDASVAAKWLLPDESDADTAAQLYQVFLTGRIALHAPSQIRHEVPSAITAATLRTPSRLSVVDGEAAIREFLAIDLILTDDTALAISAYRLVHRFGIAYYDALYTALAERYAIPFITADRKLYRRNSSLPGVLWLSDWNP